MLLRWETLVRKWASRQLCIYENSAKTGLNETLLFRQVLNSILNPNLPLGEGVFDPEEENTNTGIEETPSSVPQGDYVNLINYKFYLINNKIKF